MIDQMKEKYSVGPLLYSPALNGKIAGAVINEKFGKCYSLALCLEDSISDNSVSLAEDQLEQTLKEIFQASAREQFYLPKIFIRVRSCDQLLRLDKRLFLYYKIVSGYIFPKYTLSNADGYNQAIVQINERMLESGAQGHFESGIKGHFESDILGQS